MKIKVCGMMEPVNIQKVTDLKPDYLGFIFYPGSKRYVDKLGEEVINAIPPGIKKTGVFVDSSYKEILNNIKKNSLDAVQLHGNETAELCMALKKEGTEIIKAFGVDENFDFKTLEPYLEAVDYFLFDTKTSMYGGSGKIFDWKLLEQYPYKTSYFLSGGLSADNLSKIKHIEDQRLYAVDLNSKFETEPGIKDVKKLKRAVNYIRFKEKHELPRK